LSLGYGLFVANFFFFYQAAEILDVYYAFAEKAFDLLKKYACGYIQLVVQVLQYLFSSTDELLLVHLQLVAHGLQLLLLPQ
jgi:hypothetical protein